MHFSHVRARYWFVAVRGGVLARERQAGRSKFIRIAFNARPSPGRNLDIYRVHNIVPTEINRQVPLVPCRPCRCHVRPERRLRRWRRRQHYTTTGPPLYHQIDLCMNSRPLYLSRVSSRSQKLSCIEATGSSWGISSCETIANLLRTFFFEARSSTSLLCPHTTSCLPSSYPSLSFHPLTMLEATLKSSLSQPFHAPRISRRRIR